MKRLWIIETCYSNTHDFHSRLICTVLCFYRYLSPICEAPRRNYKRPYDQDAQKIQTKANQQFKKKFKMSKLIYWLVFRTHPIRLPKTEQIVAVANDRYVLELLSHLVLVIFENKCQFFSQQQIKTNSSILEIGHGVISVIHQLWFTVVWHRRSM